MLLACPTERPGPGAWVRDCHPVTRAPDCPLSWPPAARVKGGRPRPPSSETRRARTHSRRAAAADIHGVLGHCGVSGENGAARAAFTSRDAPLPPGGTQTSDALMCELRGQLLPVGDEGIHTARGPPIRGVLEAPTQAPLLPKPGSHRWVSSPLWTRVTAESLPQPSPLVCSLTQRLGRGITPFMRPTRPSFPAPQEAGENAPPNPHPPWVTGLGKRARGSCSPAPRPESPTM